MFLRILAAQSRTHIHRGRTNKQQVNSDGADGNCYSFAWIQRSWTFGVSYFFDGSFSLPIFYTFSEKMMKIYRLKVGIQFCKMHHRIPSFLISSSFICQAVSNASYVLWKKRCQNLELLTQRIHLYKISLGQFVSVDSSLIF